MSKCNGIKYNVFIDISALIISLFILKSVKTQLFIDLNVATIFV